MCPINSSLLINISAGGTCVMLCFPADHDNSDKHICHWTTSQSQKSPKSANTRNKAVKPLGKPATDPPSLIEGITPLRVAYKIILQDNITVCCFSSCSGPSAQIRYRAAGCIA